MTSIKGSFGKRTRCRSTFASFPPATAIGTPPAQSAVVTVRCGRQSDIQNPIKSYLFPAHAQHEPPAHILPECLFFVLSVTVAVGSTRSPATGEGLKSTLEGGAELKTRVAPTSGASSRAPVPKLLVRRQSALRPFHESFLFLPGNTAPRGTTTA